MTSAMDSHTPVLWRACLAGEVSIMNKVMDTGADPHRTDRNGESCLHMCARSGEARAVERMVQMGLALNTANHNGQTPLHVAASKGHTEVVGFIVRNGGHTDLRSKFSGMTALHLSCVESDANMVELLLNNGASCAVRDAIDRYADDYTEEESVQRVFSSHFEDCPHGRRRETKENERRPKSSVDDTAAATESVKSQNVTRSTKHSDAYHDHKDDEDDEEDDDKEDTDEPEMNDKPQKQRSKRKKAKQSERDGVQIYNKMESYDVDRVKQNWNKAKQGGRKIQINHSLGFSDQHRQRMSQNVFDRLMKK